MTATDVTHNTQRAPRSLGRRLLPLQVGVGLQGFMLWVAVEKLFQTQIGFDAASVGVMAAAYAAVVPLLEVPSASSPIGGAAMGSWCCPAPRWRPARFLVA